MTCPICKDEFIVITGGPDSFGNYDTDDCVCQTPCSTCRGARHLGPATESPQRDWGMACPDCTGTGAAYTPEQIEDMAEAEEPVDEDRVARNHGVYFHGPTS